MGNLPSLFGGKTQTSSQTTSQQSGSTTNPLAGTILQYGQSNVFPQFSASNIADTSAALGPNQYQTGAATNQAGVAQNVMPVFNSAANMAQNGINPGSVQQWMSPYTQNVIDATNRQADINDGRTLAQAQGSSALAGGLTNSAARGNMDYLRANLANNRNAMAANQYNQGYSTALDSAFKNAGVMNTGAGTAGALAGVQTGANLGAGNLGQLVYGANQNSVMSPYNLTTQGAQTMTGLVPGVGSSYSSSGTGSSSGTSQQNPGMIQSVLGGLGLWGNAADYANKNGGIMNALSSFFPSFSEGGSVMPRFGGNEDQHEKLAKTFHALKGMMNGGSAMPNRFADGGWVTSVKEEPGTARSFVDAMSGGLPQSTPSSDGLSAINAQQSALAQFMNNTKPAFPNRFADGGSTISPMSGLSQFSNSLLAASPLAGMADYNAKLQQQRMMEEQSKRQYGLDVGRTMGTFNGMPTLQAQEAVGNINGMPTIAAQAQQETARMNQRPQWTQTGFDRYGQPEYGFVNPNLAPNMGTPGARAAAPQAPGAAPPAAAVTTPYGNAVVSTPKSASENLDLTGDEFLATLPKPDQEIVKAIVEGREPFPGSMAARSPRTQRLLTWAAQYQPGFDATLWGSRNKTKQDFAAGKSAQNVTAFNTAIGHMDSLDKAVDGLQNSPYPIWNKIGNTMRENVDPKFAAKLKAFETAKTAVVDELTRAFRGSGGNVHDIVTWEKNISAADSPEALRGAIRSGMELLRSRIEALGDTYNRGMGTNKDPMELLSPKARHAIERIETGGRASDAGEQKGVVQGFAAGPSVPKATTDRLSQPGKSASAPIDVENAEQARALGSGTWVRRREDGKVLQVP